MTVLILAPELDVTADRMVKTLDHRDIPVVRMDTAWFPQHAVEPLGPKCGCVVRDRADRGCRSER